MSRASYTIRADDLIGAMRSSDRMILADVDVSLQVLEIHEKVAKHEAAMLMPDPGRRTAGSAATRTGSSQVVLSTNGANTVPIWNLKKPQHH